MYVRCPACTASTWIADADGKPAVTFVCKRCAASRDLSGIDALGPTPEERHASAVEFADRNGVDLASAYSMMLGLLPGPDESAPVATAAAPDTAERSAVETVHYDPGFREAVREGLLTPEEARELGDRDCAAARLARRHQLPLKLALDIIDCRLSVSEAIEKAPPVRVLAKTVPASRLQKAMVAGLGALAMVALVIFGGARWSSLKDEARLAEARNMSAPVSPRAAGGDLIADPAKFPVAPEVAELTAARANSDVQTDAEGRVVRITARSPRAVLDAFCSSGGGAQRHRADKVVPAAHGARLGLMHDLVAPETSLAILIRRDRRSGRWSAGNGLQPIVAAEFQDPRPGSAP